jgi:hypothetical protein
MIARRASRQDGTHPRPLLVRERWADLDGEWDFAVDDGNQGRSSGWHTGAAPDPFDVRIRVPLAIEAPLPASATRRRTNAK